MRFRVTCCVVPALLFVAGVSAADDKAKKKEGPGTIFTDPAKAGVDYQLQGEFQGSAGNAQRKIGAQVIALGGGKFRLVAYRGGLPGDGWVKPEKPADGDDAQKPRRLSRRSLEGKRDGDKVVFEDSDGPGATITVTKQGIQVTRTDDDTKVLAELKRVHRKSPTLGAKPPKGAIVLFNGKSADAFVRGKLLPGGLLAANCESKEKLGDHHLHLEFRTPFKPYDRGQARGNSGMYVQSRYEVQILDSFGLDGKNNECGGLYSIKEPDVNMCYPPLTWQTYDVEFKAAKYEGNKKIANARLTLKHNGVVIHDDVELPKGTPGKAGEGPGPLGVYLQGHGNPVVFRNIWVVKK